MAREIFLIVVFCLIWGAWLQGATQLYYARKEIKQRAAHLGEVEKALDWHRDFIRELPIECRKDY